MITIAKKKCNKYLNYTNLVNSSSSCAGSDEQNLTQNRKTGSTSDNPT